MMINLIHCIRWEGIFMKYLDRLEEYCIAICVMAMVLINFGDVFLRYLFQSSLYFAGELLLILFVWVVMLAISVGYKKMKHISLPLIFDMLTIFYQKVLIIFSSLLSGILVISLIISGTRLVIQQIEFSQVTAVLLIPEWLAGAAIPLGSLFILARLIQSALSQLRELKEVNHK